MPAFVVERAIAFEDERYRLEFWRASGALYRFFDKQARAELIREHRLGDIFRLCLPLPQTQANYFSGKQQKLTSADANLGELTLKWAGPLTNDQGQPFELAAAMSIRSAGEALLFRLDVQNRTGRPLMEVWYPIIGGSHGLGERLHTRTYVPGSDGSLADGLFWDPGIRGELGCPVAEATFVNPGNLVATWLDLYNRTLQRGIYIGLEDNTPRKKVLRFEAQPGYAHMRADPWPRPEEVDPRFPVGLILHWAYLLDISGPATDFVGAPVVLQSHAGDWRQAKLIHDEQLRSATQSPA